jgi:hypothetical protein
VSGLRIALLAGALTLAAAALAPAAFACQRGYSYAGVYSSSAASGIGATLAMLDEPAVFGGASHVAGWVGVGGPGLGPHGEDEWLQVGLATFGGSGDGRLYYELARPGRAPLYTELSSGIQPGQKVRVAVLELPFSPGSWIVISPAGIAGPFYLPASHAGLGADRNRRELRGRRALQPLLLRLRTASAREWGRELACAQPSLHAAGYRLAAAPQRAVVVQRHRRLSGLHFASRNGTLRGRLTVGRSALDRVV